MNNWLRSNEVWRTLFVLFLGQVVSLVLALASLSSSLIADLGVDAPLTQTFFTYLSLTLVYGSILLYRRKRLLVPWYWYALLGFVDVQGNYLVNKAYQYSSITSVTLLDCWTIAWVIILTWIFLDGSKPLLGDILVIAGTVFFAVSNVSEEFCVKKKDLVEFISMLGVFGMVVSVCEISIVERKTLESVVWSRDIILAFFGYALSTFMFYSLVPPLLKMSGATLFNLSALTSDMWAVVFRIFFYNQKVDWLYFVSFALVVIGLIIYSTTEKDPASEPALDDGNQNTHYQVLNEESTASRNNGLDS